jgi:hypothetical protein
MARAEQGLVPGARPVRRNLQGRPRPRRQHQGPGLQGGRAGRRDGEEGPRAGPAGRRPQRDFWAATACPEATRCPRARCKTPPLAARWPERSRGARPFGSGTPEAGHWVDRRATRGSRPYLRLARIDRPIGWWLLLLPCWWSAALAAIAARPPLAGPRALVLFLIGAVAMRGAGSTYNDIVDRDLDARVERTRLRPCPPGRCPSQRARLPGAPGARRAVVLSSSTPSRSRPGSPRSGSWRSIPS